MATCFNSKLGLCAPLGQLDAVRIFLIRVSMKCHTMHHAWCKPNALPCRKLAGPNAALLPSRHLQ